MNAGLKYALAFALAAGVGHVATILAAPRAIMDVALGKLSNDGAAINRFVFGNRVTQQSRNVVRPSPDLAYASCVYDLSRGPLLVTAAPSPDNGYVSLSVFDARTDNIAVFDTGQFPQGIRFVLAREGQAVPAGEPVVRANYDTGVILDRRLAPTAELFAAADKARRADSCAPL
ncbi:DUF1254 domain-containing protein [Novosphingobium sp.]|uniref:DUF1254 domain-containing protein n=1 Tax=Novosphingobium sp. TaxID=1874826 RepID=UPI0027342CE7|nr:DUF1254 domain-containing protein [Novosphingobium sp.]MDP3907089.1 DUF1254 domain-containing protein [Novosphingobium sp.]